MIYGGLGMYGGQSLERSAARATIDPGVIVTADNIEGHINYDPSKKEEIIEKSESGGSFYLPFVNFEKLQDSWSTIRKTFGFDEAAKALPQKESPNEISESEASSSKEEENDQEKNDKEYIIYEEQFGPEYKEVVNNFAKDKERLLDEISKQLNKAESSDQLVIFKQADKVWIVSKLLMNGAIMMTKEEFAKEFPSQYNKLAEYSDKIGRFIGDSVGRIDRKLNDILGESYSSFKYHLSSVSHEIDEKAPQIVSDGIKLIIMGGVFDAGIKVLGTTTKSVVKLVKKADKIGDTKYISSSKNDIEFGIKKIVQDSEESKLYKIANDNFDLRNFEGGSHGGHAIEKHVGKSNDWLKERFELEARLGKVIQGSTSFPDLATANKYTKETLLRNKYDIESWLKQSEIGDKRSFKSSFEQNLGYGFDRNKQYFNSINEVNIVLKKTEDGFTVHTAHPKVKKGK